MPTSINPKAFFLDTEVFVSECFDFESKKLSEIRHLASADRIRMVIPTVTVKECKKRIAKMVREAKKLLKGADVRFKLGVLRQTDINCDLLKSFDMDAASQLVEKKFDAYLLACNAIHCQTNDVSIDAVMDAYFGEDPPFGEHQKKDQFPDAFAMFALSHWQKRNNHAVHVISKDGDLTCACAINPQLLTHNGVSEFLDFLNKEEEEKSNFVLQQITAQKKLISTAIHNQFPNLGFILIDQDGDVEDVNVDDVEFGEPSILALNEGQADVELPVKVSFSANVTFEDANSGIWDSEDKRLYFQDTINDSIEREEEITALLELHWDTDGTCHIGVTLPFEDIKVRHDEGDYY